MMHYILQTIVFQLFFLVVYDAFLKKETFFNWNRIYLLVTVTLSLILPFIKIDSFKEVVPENFIMAFPNIMLGSSQNFSDGAIPLDAVIVQSNSLSSLEFTFLLGVFFALIVFLYKFSRIVRLIYKNPKQWNGRVFIVKLLASNAAFSFFHYVFLGERIKPEEKEAIFKHELIHVKQRHTIDLLFFEMLRIVFWFNPLVYIYQNQITTLHEFIADADAIKYEDKSNYYQNLLAQVFETKNISFINTFFKESLIKKRIIMLSKSKSKQINLLKYTLFIPAVVGMLIYTSCEQKFSPEEDVSISENEDTAGSIMIEKIATVKEHIQVQGNMSEEEQKGLNLLLKITKEDTFNPELLEEVQAFVEAENKTKLMQSIADVFEQIQVQGNMSEEEVKTLKALLILIDKNGLNDPYFQDVLDRVDIPFAVIDNVPVFPSCETLISNLERKKCMSDNIANHVHKNFNVELASNLDLKGRQRISVIFKISNIGEVVGVRARAAHPVLEAEAIRVIKTLPKFQPGMQDGKAVNVPYSLPILFELK